MKIILKPMPQPDEPDMTCVGTADGQPLTYVERRPHIGATPVSHGDIADALLEAVEDAAGALFGGEWSKPLALVTGLNQRTCNRDRIRRWSLPPWTLRLLAEGSAQPDARTLGDFMMGLARMYQTGDESDPRSLVASGGTLLDVASDLLLKARRERSSRLQAQNDNGDSTAD